MNCFSLFRKCSVKNRESDRRLMMKRLSLIIPIILLFLAEDALAGGRFHGRHRHKKHHKYFSAVHIGFGYHYRPRRAFYNPFAHHNHMVIHHEKEKLIIADGKKIMRQIQRLKDFRDAGIINDKDFTKAKKKLLGRIGEDIPKRKSPKRTAKILNELEALFSLEQNGTLTVKEYNKKKKSLLKMI